MTPPEIFDQRARSLRRDRIAHAQEGFLSGLIIDEVIDRLASVQRAFENVLVLGAEPRLIAALAVDTARVTVADPSAVRAARHGGIQIDEDRLPFAAASFDLVVVAGLLDTVADLPGALLLIRRTLKPDGLFLGCMAGAPSLPALRAVACEADGVSGISVARLHPQIDVRSAGDLLVRAGFALPVADLDTFDLAYPDLGGLIADLRAAAATNVLVQRHAVSRRWLEVAKTAFAARAGTNGRTHETISLITLTGWAPSPDQPQPARRGSGTRSLAEALKR